MQGSLPMFTAENYLDRISKADSHELPLLMPTHPPLSPELVTALDWIFPHRPFRGESFSG